MKARRIVRKRLKRDDQSAGKRLRGEKRKEEEESEGNGGFVPRKVAAIKLSLSRLHRNGASSMHLLRLIVPLSDRATFLQVRRPAQIGASCCLMHLSLVSGHSVSSLNRVKGRTNSRQTSLASSQAERPEKPATRVSESE